MEGAQPGEARVDIVTNHLLRREIIPNVYHERGGHLGPGQHHPSSAGQAGSLLGQPHPRADSGASVTASRAFLRWILDPPEPSAAAVPA